MNPKVSVIIPTRNRPSYLKEALDSVYAQTFQEFEIIVVDSSTDPVRPLVMSYDGRVHYIDQARKGIAAARNRGLAEAKGEYVAFLDDDDLYLQEKLQENVDYLDRHPETAWLCSGFSFIDGAGNLLPRPAILFNQDTITLHDIALFTFIHTSSVMVRRENLLKAGGFPEALKVSEDYHTWARVLMADKGAALPACLTRFRLHKGNGKLPFYHLLRDNTRIIDMILHTQPADCQPRSYYMHNLYRIIGDSLLYKKQYMQYLLFSCRRWLGR